jgi:hypothetical protein
MHFHVLLLLFLVLLLLRYQAKYLAAEASWKAGDMYV